MQIDKAPGAPGVLFFGEISSIFAKPGGDTEKSTIDAIELWLVMECMVQSMKQIINECKYLHDLIEDKSIGQQ